MKKKKSLKRRKNNLIPIHLRKKVYEDHNNELTYWMGLLVILLCNIIASLVLVPFFVVVDATLVYLSIVIFALIFGVLFTFVIHHIPSLELYHHVFGTVVLAVVAILTIAVMVTLSNGLTVTLQISRHYSPIGLGFLYGCVFLVPYGLYQGYRRL